MLLLARPTTDFCGGYDALGGIVTGRKEVARLALRALR